MAKNKRYVTGSIKRIPSDALDPSTSGFRIYHPWMKDDASIPPYIKILNESVEYDPRQSQTDEMKVWGNHFFSEAFSETDFAQCESPSERRLKAIQWVQDEMNRNWWKRLHCRLWGHDLILDPELFQYQCQRCDCRDSLRLQVLRDNWYYPTVHLAYFINRILIRFHRQNIFFLLYDSCLSLYDFCVTKTRHKIFLAKVIAAFLWFDHIWFDEYYGDQQYAESYAQRRVGGFDDYVEFYYTDVVEGLLKRVK